MLISFFLLQGATPTCENKGAELYTNGSAGHMNGTELTKMKEVAFQKNPSEPMVRLIRLRTHRQSFVSKLGGFVSLTSSSSTVSLACRGSL